LNGPGDDNGTVGAVWVFTRTNGVWSQQGEKLIGASTDTVWIREIQSVAISADGNTVALGRPGDKVAFEGNTLIFNGRSDNRGNGAGWVFTRADGSGRNRVTNSSVRVPLFHPISAARRSPGTATRLCFSAFHRLGTPMAIAGSSRDTMAVGAKRKACS